MREDKLARALDLIDDDLIVRSAPGVYRRKRVFDHLCISLSYSFQSIKVSDLHLHHSFSSYAAAYATENPPKTFSPISSSPSHTRARMAFLTG